MTIKAYVLDALQKFWNRLKTSYVTDCETDDDNLALAASQGKALKEDVDTKLNKTGDEILQLTGSVPRVSVTATNVSGRLVASDTSNRFGLWDEINNSWVIFRTPDGKTRIGESGGIYYGYASLPDFAQSFKSKPFVQYSMEYTSNGNNAWLWGRSAASKTNPGSVYIGRGASAPAKDYLISVIAVGEWDPDI